MIKTSKLQKKSGLLPKALSLGLKTSLEDNEFYEIFPRVFLRILA